MTAPDVRPGQNVSARWTPDILERIFHAALGAGDIKGVEAALTVLAVRDPHRAQRLMDLTQCALAIRTTTDGSTR